MRSSIHFGAGNIGRGFIGAVLEGSGYHILFADVNDEIIRSINNGSGYVVHITDTIAGEQKVCNVSAVHIDDPSLARDTAAADLVTTAVGLGVIPCIAPNIASGISERSRRCNTAPMNIIACENGVGVTSLLKKEIYKYLDDGERAFADKYIGFADCSVDRIAPPIRYSNPADVSVERFYEWNVDRNALKGTLPAIAGMNLTDNLQAYTERKLFTLNTGHAITAYIGYLKGYETIDEAIADKEILATVRGAMQESGLALIRKYGFDREEHFEYIEKIIDRFRNPFLHDELARVCREPMRKLSSGDRLIKPFVTARGYGIKTPNLVMGIAFALNYDDPEDTQSLQMQKMFSEKDERAAIAEITGLSPDSEELEEIRTAYDTIKIQRQ